MTTRIRTTKVEDGGVRVEKELLGFGFCNHESSATSAYQCSWILQERSEANSHDSMYQDDQRL